jgi:FemAB-related protein (PEP-CTERM system-associated)
MAVDLSRFNASASEWDAFVRAQSGWTHFHLYGWRTVIERTFRHECVYLAARDPSSNAVTAVLPMVRVKSVIFGHFLVSMPFVNYGGPLGTESGIRALTAEAARLAVHDRVKLLELRNRTPLPIDLPASHRKITVLLDLPSGPDELWSALPSKLRSQIKRPQKDGVEVRVGADQVEAFHAVFAHHMRDLGTPALPKRFFQALAEVFPSDTRFAVAYHNGQPVACGCGFLWNGEFEITWASALRSHKAMSPNMLVYWELMRDAIRSGARLFNFGRCTPNSGTHKFKTQWGGRDEQLWWYQRASKPEQIDGASTPSPDQGLFALATRVWQRLPVPVATRLGPAIVRLIP